MDQEHTSKLLEAAKSPLVFNGFTVLMAVLVVIFARPSASQWAVLGFIAAVTIWFNIFAALDPRFLAYGAHEYLRETELAHEREMAKLKVATTKSG